MQTNKTTGITKEHGGRFTQKENTDHKQTNQTQVGKSTQVTHMR